MGIPTISKLKKKLATIPTTSRRYRMLTHDIFSHKRIANAHACTVYWVYLPMTIFTYIVFTIGLIAAAPIVFSIIAIFNLISWIFGFYPGWLKRDKNPQNTFITHTPNSSLYKYGYNPITQKTTKFAPWMILLPLVIVSIFMFGNISFGNFFSSSLPYLIVGLSVAFIIIILTSIIKKRIEEIKAIYEKICPKVQIEEDV